MHGNGEGIDHTRGVSGNRGVYITHCGGCVGGQCMATGDTPLSATILSLRLRYEKMCIKVSLLSTTLLQVGREGVWCV